MPSTKVGRPHDGKDPTLLPSFLQTSQSTWRMRTPQKGILYPNLADVFSHFFPTTFNQNQHPKTSAPPVLTIQSYPSNHDHPIRIASVTSKNIGIIHVDRHADIQETDLDERMHTTPYFHATNIPNVPAKNLVQIGIGGWQVGLRVVLYWYTFEIW